MPSLTLILRYLPPTATVREGGGSILSSHPSFYLHIFHRVEFFNGNVKHSVISCLLMCLSFDLTG